MAKVITFSRTFPAYHPKAGQPTYFVEQFWKSLIETKLQKELWIDHISPYKKIFGDLVDFDSVGVKSHTIRAGHRWKAGDYFSPRVWSGRPYNSKMITIGPDTLIESTYEFSIKKEDDYVLIEIEGWPFYEKNKRFETFKEEFETLAQNDGLELQDLKDWFKYPKPFEGQIICWNKNINY